jgi:lysophospholipase L1-like esterase
MLAVLGVVLTLVTAGAAGDTGTAAVGGEAFRQSPAYPDPARFEAAISALEEEHADREPGGFLCIGSSSMRFWHDDLATDLAPLDPIGCGFGGSTMYDVLHFADRIVLPFRPRAILLYEGDNDIDFGVSAADFVDTFRFFVTTVRRELPGTRIWVMSVKPCPARWDHWPEMREANAMLERECEENELLHWVDVATPMLGPDDYPRAEIFLPDSLHMNRDGYDIWRDAVREVLIPVEAPAVPAAAD